MIASFRAPRAPRVVSEVVSYVGTPSVASAPGTIDKLNRFMNEPTVERLFEI